MIWAEGALSETFVDDGGAGVFHNAAERAAMPMAQSADPARYCAPRLDSGPMVQAVRDRIQRRAAVRKAS